jgi:hypothetical protein
MSAIKACTPWLDHYLLWFFGEETHPNIFTKLRRPTMCYNIHSMKQHLQKFLLAIFVLLQCVSPLVHAHTDGDSDAAYAHEISVHTSMGGTHAKQHDCAVISTPHAYSPCNISSINHPSAVQVSNLFTLNISAITSAPLASPSSVIANPRYLSPWSQAPPRIISSV